MNLDAHQQAAVRAAHDAEPARGRDLARDQVLRDGGEVVVDQLPVRLEPRFVPRRTELAAAADVGQHEHAAVLEPELAGGAGVGRRHRDLESAIGGEHRRVGAVELHRLRVHDEVRHLGSVLRRRLALLDGVARRVELRRAATWPRRSIAASRVGEPHAARREKTRDVQQRFGAVQVHVGDRDRQVVGKRQWRRASTVRWPRA